MKKVTMQDIADALNVSRITIWKAFNKPDTVSDTLRDQIMEKALQMGYSKMPMTGESSQQFTDSKTVSVIVSRPDSSIFWTNIIHHIAKELSKQNINLLYTYAPSSYRQDFFWPSYLTNGSISGVIVLNIYDNTLIKMISSLPVPKVFYDTVSAFNSNELNGDLILVEGISSVKELTTHLIEKGCKKIGFIGDTAYARTNLDRYLGFKQAMDEAKLKIDENYCYTQSIPISEYESTIFKYLDSLKKLPDAFVCASDFVAHFLYQYFDKKDILVPEDIMICGFDRTPEYSNVADKLTSVHVDTSFIGKRMTRELLQRIENPADPFETLYIKTTPVYRESTKD